MESCQRDLLRKTPEVEVVVWLAQKPTSSTRFFSSHEHVPTFHQECLATASVDIAEQPPMVTWSSWSMWLWKRGKFTQFMGTPLRSKDFLLTVYPNQVFVHCSKWGFVSWNLRCKFFQPDFHNDNCGSTAVKKRHPNIVSQKFYLKNKSNGMSFRIPNWFQEKFRTDFPGSYNPTLNPSLWSISNKSYLNKVQNPCEIPSFYWLVHDSYHGLL